jgi:3-oxoacyl-(acyl-carrier-protein) synthase
MANNSDRRVVITGLGVVTPLGHQLDVFWNALIAGQCGIDKITAFDTAAFDTKIAGEVKNFDPAPAFPSPKEVRRTDRNSAFSPDGRRCWIPASNLKRKIATKSASSSAPASAACTRPPSSTIF